MGGREVMRDFGLLAPMGQRRCTCEMLCLGEGLPNFVMGYGCRYWQLDTYNLPVAQWDEEEAETSEATEEALVEGC